MAAGRLFNISNYINKHIAGIASIGAMGLQSGNKDSSVKYSTDANRSDYRPFQEIQNRINNGQKMPVCHTRTLIRTFINNAIQSTNCHLNGNDCNKYRTTYTQPQLKDARITATALCNVQIPGRQSCRTMTTTSRTRRKKNHDFSKVKDCFFRVMKTENIHYMSHPIFVLLIRAVVMTSYEYSTYVQLKNILRDGSLQIAEGLRLHLAAGLTTSIMACAIFMPIETLKLRVLPGSKELQGVLKGRHMIKVFIQIGRKEGICSYFRGFITYCCRTTPQTVALILAIEQIWILYSKLKNAFNNPDIKQREQKELDNINNEKWRQSFSKFYYKNLNNQSTEPLKIWEL